MNLKILFVKRVHNFLSCTPPALLYEEYFVSEIINAHVEPGWVLPNPLIVQFNPGEYSMVSCGRQIGIM